MCRHAAYLGPSISLEQFLVQPSHSLVEQSFRPKEMLTAEVNVDGFGVGWYMDDGTARRYVNPAPIWADRNIVQLGPVLESRFWLGNVRSATVPESVTSANTPPYGVGKFLFSHNGYIKDFAEHVRPAFRRFLKPEIEADVHGNTDSEYLFALMRQMLPEHNDDVVKTMGALFEQIYVWMQGALGLFNFLILDGERIYATRHAIDHDAPSLYLGQDEKHFPGGWLIASEPLSASGEWLSVPKHHLVVLSLGSPPEQIAL